MSFTNYLEEKILDHVFNGVTYTPPATIYVAMYSTMPGEDGTGGVEITGGGYARQAVSFGAAAVGQVANDAVVNFTNMPAGTVAGAALVDASTAGNILSLATFATSKTYAGGENVTMAVGALVQTLD